LVESVNRSNNLKKNILFSFAFKGLNILLSLCLVPITMEFISNKNYGIWLTLSSIIGWISFFDIGLGNGLRNKFTEAIALRKIKLAKIYVSTTYAILTIIILSIMILFLFVNNFINWSKILNSSSDVGVDLNFLASVVFSCFSIQFILQLINTILIANQQPSKSAAVSFFTNLFTLIIIFILSKTIKGNLLLVGLIYSVIPVLVLIIYSFILFQGEYKQFAPSLKYIRFKFANKLTTLGFRFFIIQITAIVIFQTNNVIITQLFGPDQVTPYNIAFKYFGVISMGATIIMSPLWSAFTDAWTKKDIDWIKETVIKLQYIWLALLITGLIMLYISPIIYKTWLGNKIQISFEISLWMCIFFLISSWNMIYVQFLNGVGKISLQLISGIFGTLIIIPVSYVFAEIYGIKGIIITQSLLVLINTLWTYLQYKKIISKTAKGIWNK
jgi:O-antigen/teichoic acid export membrane protein